MPRFASANFAVQPQRKHRIWLAPEFHSMRVASWPGFPLLFAVSCLVIALNLSELIQTTHDRIRTLDKRGRLFPTVARQVASK
jgi:hypothetical protein